MELGVSSVDANTRQGGTLKCLAINQPVVGLARRTVVLKVGDISERPLRGLCLAPRSGCAMF